MSSKRQVDISLLEPQVKVRIMIKIKLSSILVSILTLWCCQGVEVELEMLDVYIRTRNHVEFYHIGVLTLGANIENVDTLQLHCDSDKLIVDMIPKWIPPPAILQGDGRHRQMLPLHMTELERDLLERESFLTSILNMAIDQDANENPKTHLIVLVDCSFDHHACKMGARNINEQCYLSAESSPVFESHPLIWKPEPSSVFEVDFSMSHEELDYASDSSSIAAIFLETGDRVTSQESLLSQPGATDPCTEQTIAFGNCVKSKQDIRQCESEQHSYMACKKDAVLGAASDVGRPAFAAVSSAVSTQSRAQACSTGSAGAGFCPPGPVLLPDFGVKLDLPIDLPFGPDFGVLGGMIIAAIIHGAVGKALMEKIENFVQIAAKIVPPILTKAMCFGFAPPIDLSILMKMAMQMKDMLEMLIAQAQMIAAQVMSKLAAIMELFNYIKQLLMDLLARLKAMMDKLARMLKMLNLAGLNAGNFALDLSMLKIGKLNFALNNLQMTLDFKVNALKMAELQTITPSVQIQIEKLKLEVKAAQSKVQEKTAELAKTAREGEKEIENAISAAAAPFQEKMESTVAKIKAGVVEASKLVKAADIVMNKIEVEKKKDSPAAVNDTMVDDLLAASVAEVSHFVTVEQLEKIEQAASEIVKKRSAVLRAPKKTKSLIGDEGEIIGPLISLNASLSATSVLGDNSPRLWWWNSGASAPQSIELSWATPVEVSVIRLRALHEATGTHDIVVNGVNVATKFKPSDGYKLFATYKPPLHNVTSLAVRTKSLKKGKASAASTVGWQSIEVYGPITDAEDAKALVPRFADRHSGLQTAFQESKISFLQVQASQSVFGSPGEKPAGDGLLTQILVIDLSHQLTTMFTKVITKDFGDVLVPELKRSLGGVIEVPIVSYLVEKLSSMLGEAVPIALDQTVGQTLKTNLPQRLEKKLTKSLTASLTRSLTHIIPPAIAYTLKAREEGMGEAADDLTRAMQASDFYASYFSDYYTDLFLKDPKTPAKK